MIIDGVKYPTIAVFHEMMTVPDCLVTRSNKLGKGHGEAKFYIASKEEMYSFYGHEKFSAQCFMLKKDLIAYLVAVKNEYLHPSQPYNGSDRLPKLWSERYNEVSRLDDVIYFTIHDQHQIGGPRGYVKSNDKAYNLIRDIALPIVSYIYVEKLGSENKPLYYWKLFVDFEAILHKKNGPLVFNYGKKKVIAETKIISESKSYKTQGRIGQNVYRQKLLDQCRFCPFTKVADDRLLIASHIKPWAACNDFEKTDPHNGYMLTPMYDKLFDQGYITFTPDRRVICSEVISPYNWKLIGLENNTFLKELPMDDRRIKYLKFHHESVYKGHYNFD